MNHDTPDGAEGLFRPQLQAAMAVAGRLGEVLARQRAEQNEQMLRAEEARRKQLQERFEAERAVMRTQLGAVYQPQFWESANPEDIAAQYALAQQWEPFDDMARLSREHIHDEIRIRHELTPEEYLERQTVEVTGNAEPEVEAATSKREAERDHAAAELESAAVVTGDLQNDVDTQNAAANTEALWDSGDRRAKLADFLMERVGTTDVGREGVAAVLAADVSNGTPPSAAVKVKRGKRIGRSQESPQVARVEDRDFGLG